MRNAKVILFLMYFYFVSCQNNITTEQPEEVVCIDKIILQFYPSFHSPAIIMLDVANGNLLFQRIGRKITYKVDYHPQTIKEVINPKSVYYKVDSLSMEHIKDLIFFGENDLCDGYIDADDGILTNMLLTFNNGSFLDIEISNSETENHRKLIKYLLDLIIENQTDTLSRDYLYNLKGYYR